jgi:hypothetical protein
MLIDLAATMWRPTPKRVYRERFPAGSGRDAMRA